MAQTLLKCTVAIRACVAAAITLAGLGSVSAQGSAMLKPTIAVLEMPSSAMIKQAEFAPLSSGIQVMLSYALAANPSIVVVERQRIQEILAEQNLVTDGRVSPEQAAKVGKLLGAGHILMGGFTVFPDNSLVFSVRAVNSETGVLDHSEQVRGKSDKVMDIIDQMATKLNANLKLPGVRDPKSVKDQGLGGRNQLEAAQAYTAAQRLEEKGDRKGAMLMYQKVVQLNPEFGIAKTSLAALEKKQF